MNLLNKTIFSAGIFAVSFLSPILLFAKTPKVLIFSKTLGFHHKSIANGIDAIQKLGNENKFVSDTTTDASKFTYKNLKQYKTIIFLSPTGDVLNAEQEAAFKKYINSGGGFVGIHAASDCEFNWEWYGNLVGAFFVSHPAQQEAVIKVDNQHHTSTQHLPSEWKRKDEWYNFKFVYDKVHVLLSLDEKSYNAGKNSMGDKHPIAWYHEYDGGKAFYTALGHTEESYTDPLFLKHLLGGIKYAMGKK